MAVVRTYECPSCERQFDFLHMPSDEPPPRFCPHCGFDSQAEDVPKLTFGRAVVAPAILKGKAKNIDGYVRAMEEGENFRADKLVAAGLDRDQANAIKTTNMQDSLREGDVSIKPPENAVTQAMRQPVAPTNNLGMQSWGLQRDPSAALAASASAHTGPAPYAGARAVAALRKGHAESAFDPKQAGAISSELPALETTGPNYRRRA